MRAGHRLLSRQIAADVRCQGTRILVAIFTYLGERLEDDAFQLIVDDIRMLLAPDSRVLLQFGILGSDDFAGRSGFHPHDVVQDITHVAHNFVGKLAGQGLTKGHPERVHVRARAGQLQLAFGLLWTGPGERAEELTSERKWRLGSYAVAGVVAGNTEVQDVGQIVEIHAGV